VTGWIRPWRTRVARTGVAVAMGLGSVPAAALATDPAEPYALPGTTPAAIAADVDGDGAREVVRITGPADAVRLEVWDVVDGQWAATLSVEPEGVPGRGRVIGGNTATALVRARVDGLDRALLLTGGSTSGSDAPGCCLALQEVVDGGDRPELRPLPAPELPAESIVVADLDGDGTDELVASLVNWSEDGSRSSTNVAVLGRDADRWRTLAEWEESGAWWVMSLGETDGAPGTELLAAGEAGDLARVAWIDGALQIERARLVVDNEQAWVAGSIDGNLVVTSSTTVALFRWPRGDQPTMLASHETLEYPSVGVLGSGSESLVVVQEHTERGTVVPVSQVLDARLRPIGEVATTAQAAVLADVAERLARDGWTGSPPTNIWPYFGPEDGEWDGGATSYIVGGMRVTAAPGGSFETRPSASLVGRPIGRVGPDGGWVALGDSYVSTGAISYLQPGFFPFEGSTLTLVPLATFQDPAERTLATSIALEGGIATGEDGDASTILAAPTGVEIIITVVPGTVAVSWDGTRVTDHGEVDAGELRLSVDPPSRPRPGSEYSFERDLILLGPDGSATVHRWNGTFAPEAPELTAWTRLEGLSLDATVAGRASAGSRITVDGRDVTLNGFGAYRATVDAPPWPRTVVVVARDPFGGEQRATVEVIGLVDYRGLPWVPIAGAATLLGGVVLFLRTPRHRPLAQRPVLDDGRLEDLDGDLV
jgi:hypothetical protein